MGVPQQRYDDEQQCNCLEGELSHEHSLLHNDINHLNVLRHISDIFTASISYATQLAEIRYSQCSEYEMTELEKKYGGEHGQVVTGLVRDAAELVGVDLLNYRVTTVEPHMFPEQFKRMSFYELIEQLQSMG